ncbi:MAG: cupin domain-containing protein [Alphaproteobacteria bacterium]
MHWTVVAGAAPPPHRHARYDETFYVLRGTLNFLIEDKVVAMTDGDFVRVPAGTRHAYTNNSDATVELLVGMSPGGMEKLFLQAGESETLDLDWYFKEAKEAHQTIYEMG